MKENIKKLLLEADSKTEIKDFSKEIISKARLPKCEVEKRFKLPLFVKLSFAPVVLAIVLIVALVTSNNDDSFVPTPNYEVSKVDSIIGFEALSLGNIVQSEVAATTNTSISFISLDHDDDDDHDDDKPGFQTSEYSEAIATLNNYMLTIEGLFSGDATHEVFLEASDLPEYTYKMKTTASNLFDSVDYTIYYKETALNKDASRIAIEGIILVGSESYQIEGTYEKEKNDEVTTELAIYTSSTTKIIVEQETETNENEWVYKYYQKNKCISEIEFELENDVVSLSVENKTTDVDFEYEITKSGEVFSIILESKSGKSGIITASIDYETNTYIFSSINTEISCNRKNWENKY